MSVKRRDRAYPISGVEDPTAYSPNGYMTTTSYEESPVIPSAAGEFSTPSSHQQQQLQQSRPISGNMSGLGRHPNVHRRRESASASSAATPSSAYPPATYASPTITGHSARRVVSEPRAPGEMRLTKRHQPGRDERRDSVPHKSPLQQLETTLSKEEKRARLEEAET
jgi:hypothetical protein